MATFQELERIAEIDRHILELRITRADIGNIRANDIAKSLKHFPPPRRALSDADVRRLLEPAPIRWHKDLIPDYRTTSTPETIPYYRYSTDMQGDSTEQQRGIVEPWFEMRVQTFNLPPMTSKEFADPETSGGKPLFERRWGGQLASYVRPGDHLVFAYYDRIGRDALDTLNALKKFMEMRVYVHIIDHAQFQFCDPKHPTTIKQIQEAAIEAEHTRRKIGTLTARADKSFLARGFHMGAVRHRCFRKVKNPDYNPDRQPSPTNQPYLAKFSAKEAAQCEVIYRLWAVYGWLVPEILSAMRTQSKRDPHRWIRYSTGKIWNRDGVKKLIRKYNAERAGGGAAGMFANAALNGTGGVN